LSANNIMKRQLIRFWRWTARSLVWWPRRSAPRVQLLDGDARSLVRVDSALDRLAQAAPSVKRREEERPARLGPGWLRTASMVGPDGFEPPTKRL
jgi:hypothetical protein